MKSPNGPMDTPEEVIERFADDPPAEAAEGIRKAIMDADSSTKPVVAAAVARFLASHRDNATLLGLIDPSTVAEVADRLLDRLRADPAVEDVAATYDLLDAVRLRPFRRRVREGDSVREWADRLTGLIDASDFTFPRLFDQRLRRHPSRPLFVVPGPSGSRHVTWRQVGGRVDLIARGLCAVTRDDPSDRTVAVLARNSLEMALVDLACLTSGVVNVMIPATATDADITYILGHARVGTLIVSSRDLLDRALAVRSSAPDLRRIVYLGTPSGERRDLLPLEAVMERAREFSRDDLAARRDAIRIGDRATVMYTSGTTGTPKGICFTHRNIVSKRFHRALALPEIGEGDVFLCYLPLFHTFGRYLEMCGCAFWGATYVFAESPAIEALIRQMQTHQPSVFISIPMKWMQLHEAVGASADLELADDETLGRAVAEVTGGNLRWGLSAAGYLDPDIFRFFQRHGVELMSGFGMTEATGGITMTPPGSYREDSLGPALPGIDLALGEDGELLVKGPYVMEGYLDPPDGEESFDADGWFHTGDLMEMSDDGFIRIIDRKKEIYKNIKGQTVAPQKIENLFRDFPSVDRVFLVGDHRPYNTALIHPNADFAEVDLSSLGEEELRAHFRSLVITANTFLSPFERIVDFAVIARDFDADKGELTPKNTYRRKTIERNFSDVIRTLYQRLTLEVGGTEVLVPNWVFQSLGVTAQDLHVDREVLRMTGTDAGLVVRRLSETTALVGSVVYHLPATGPLNLGTLLSVPRLWLGNEALVAFASLETEQRAFKRRRKLRISWQSRDGSTRPSADQRTAVDAAARSGTTDLMDLHALAVLLDSEESADALAALRAAEHILESSETEIVDECLRILRRTARHTSTTITRRAFQVLATHEPGPSYGTMIQRFLDGLPDLFDDDTAGLLAERSLDPDQLGAIMTEAERRWSAESDADSASASSLLHFLAAYGAHHPTAYRGLRAFITRAALTATDDEIRRTAGEAIDTLRSGFRNWLGSLSRIAVDPETGFEYRWEDVVAFADDVDGDARDRLLAALTSTAMLREGIFLFSGGVTVGLSDILPGGLWIRHLGTDHGKSVYRVAVKTRTREPFDLAVNLNRELEPFQVAEEIDWLIVCGSAKDRRPLVEEFGGWWPDHGLWTEEFIGGDTLDRGLRRVTRRPDGEELLVNLWPHAAWSALAAYVDFWDRTGRRLEVADPTPANIVVPLHDYHTDARLVSIAARRPFSTVSDMLLRFKSDLIDPVEQDFPVLRGEVSWAVPCAALLEIVGEREGADLLREALADPATETMLGFRDDVSDFLDSVAERGFVPRRLWFAGKRFRRWDALNPDATPLARATTLQEIYDTYALQTLTTAYPEARARFFADTVFRDSPPALTEGLETMIRQMRLGEMAADDLSAAIADLRAHLDLDEASDYFLARLSYPHLRPEDEAVFVPAEAGGAQQSEVVVTHEDREGEPFRIRHAVNAKEIGRLHRLFLAAKLSVQFRREHRFLIAINDRGQLLGGLFYEFDAEARSAHMDKIVVTEAFQGRGIAGHLLEELCHRVRSAGAVSVTTGFFRPQFFYSHGFSVERRYAGLVRRLDEPDEKTD